MGKIFFIADTHFGDENIIRYENRPFSTVYEMDNALISNWNKTVSNRDEVFLLGDFSMYNREKSIEIGKKLNGKKTLILGNHDIQSEQFYLDCGVSSVIRYPIVYQNFWILSHEPMYINNTMPYANIFGHVHGNIMYKTVTSQSYCISVERIDYTPIDFDSIKTAMGISR